MWSGQAVSYRSSGMGVLERQVAWSFGVSHDSWPARSDAKVYCRVSIVCQVLEAPKCHSEGQFSAQLSLALLNHLAKAILVEWHWLA